MTDYKKEPQEIVLDLINHDNHTNLDLAKLLISGFSAVSGTKATTIVVSAKAGSGYTGEQTLTYNRVPLVEVPSVENAGVAREFQILHYSDVLAFINTTFGLNIKTTDVTINGVSLTQSDPAVSQDYDVANTYTIAAVADAPVWFGSAQLKFTKIKTDIATVWTLTSVADIAPPTGIAWPAKSVAVTPAGNLIQRPDGSYRVRL